MIQAVSIGFGQGATRRRTRSGKCVYPGVLALGMHEGQLAVRRKLFFSRASSITWRATDRDRLHPGAKIGRPSYRSRLHGDRRDRRDRRCVPSTESNFGRPNRRPARRARATDARDASWWLRRPIWRSSRRRGEVGVSGWSQGRRGSGRVGSGSAVAGRTVPGYSQACPMGRRAARVRPARIGFAELSAKSPSSSGEVAALKRARQPAARRARSEKR